MKKRILSILLALCMLRCLVPVSALADDTALRSVAVQSIGSNEAEVELDLYEKMTAQVSVIKLISDIELSGSLRVDYAVTIDLNGHVLKMGDIGDGSVIKIESIGDLTIIDSRPDAEHRFNSDNILWTPDEQNGKEIVKGGIITGGSAGYGGGVHIEAGGRFTMKGGSIVGCLASRDSSGYGGGVYVIDGGTFEMNDGAAIIGCVANYGYGGGVYCEGRFIMNGGTIRDCTAFTAGAIDYRGETPFTLNGKIIAGSNDITGHPDPGVTGTTISMRGGSNLILGDKADIQADISVSICTIHANGGVVKGNVSSYSESTVCVDEGVTGGTIIYGQIRGSYISVDGPAVTYKLNGVDYAVQVLRSGSTATKPDTPTKMGHSFDGWHTSDGTKWDYNTAVTENITLTGSLYVPVTSETELAAALADGTVDVIRLMKDIDISSSLTILRKVTLDLNGYVLRYSDTTANGSVFRIVSTGDLTIIDSSPGAEHKFKVNGTDPWVLDETNGTESVLGGVIYGGTGTPCYEDDPQYFVACGGGVYLEGDARFTMNGGNIVGCIADTGGGVCISENGSFTMNGGSIVGCSSWFRSGPGGTPYFGGVYLDSGTFTMTGGVIKDCAKYSVALRENATMNANGGEIYGVVEVGKNSYVTCLDGLTGVTVFRDNFWIYHNSARVDWGIFYGSITNYYSDPIIGLTVTYNDGDSEYAKQVLPSGTLATRPDALAPRTGYTFGGWNKADGTAWDYASDRVTDNITLYAKWTANTYTITFDTAGGSEIAPITQDYGTAITEPADPTREGYTFTGWDREIPTTMPAENITVTAQWEINQYTITFDTAGGSEIAPITQDYGTVITEPANPTREGYTFTGWDREIPTTMPAENMTVTAQWEINQYTITFDTAGGSEIAPITQDYGTVITKPANPTREGYTFTGWDREIPTTMPAENITLKARWKDTEKPTGEIIIGTNKWHEFLNKLTLGLFFKDTQEVTINAADNSGTVFASYLITDQDLSEAELGSLVYRAYDEPFRIDPNGEYIVYVMLVDESMNITYLRSDRITLDNVRPIITGIENGKTYCAAQTVTIDEKYIDNVTVNGTEVTLDENGSFILPAADGKQKIVVTDKAGNAAEITVTVNDGHTFGEWKPNGDGTHSRECTVDGCNGLETKDCSGGKATCAERAVCEVCGKAYGEIKKDNHYNLKHIDAKAATEDAEGNIEYWHCSGCDKYYSDKDGTKEIKKADIVTAKLPDDSKSPKTGDNSNLMLWIALLFISGGACTALTVKRKRSYLR